MWFILFRVLKVASLARDEVEGKKDAMLLMMGKKQAHSLPKPRMPLVKVKWIERFARLSCELKIQKHI